MSETITEPDNGTAAAAEDATPPAAEPAEAPKSKERGYGVFQKIVLDVNDGEKALAKLRGLAVPKEEGGDEYKPLYILARLGACQAKTPRESLEVVGSVRDLSGTYEAIADNNRQEFKDVKSEIKRTVTIG